MSLSLEVLGLLLAACQFSSLLFSRLSAFQFRSLIQASHPSLSANFTTTRQLLAAAVQEKQTESDRASHKKKMNFCPHRLSNLHTNQVQCAPTAFGRSLQFVQGSSMIRRFVGHSV